jgi:pimeloyl-ACP methyl ester carboxylesterase
MRQEQPVASSQEKSTTVRTKAAVKVSPRERHAHIVRPIFRALEPVAPALGGRLAWKLWTTPSEPSATVVARSREGGMGEVREIRVELPDWTGRKPNRRNGSPKPPLAAALAVELLGPADGPIVYLLHGWGGWRGQFAPIGRRLAADGFRVVLVDAPNHGDSGPGALGPKTSLLPDFSRALEALIGAIGPAHAVIGHSLGAAASALALLDGVRAEKAVFIAPPSDPVEFTHVLGGMLGFGERIRARMVRIAERRTGVGLAGLALPARLARRADGADRAADEGRADLPAALVLHDANDRVVPVATGREVAESWPGARIVETSGLGHNRILRDEAVIAAVAGFLERDTDANGVDRRRDVNGATVAG